MLCASNLRTGYCFSLTTCLGFSCFPIASVLMHLALEFRFFFKYICVRVTNYFTNLSGFDSMLLV